MDAFSSPPILFLAVGGALIIVCLFFCCYLCHLRHQGYRDVGYRKAYFKKISKNTSNEECPVCLEEFKCKEEILICNCQHGFHQQCLQRWLQQKNTCPMCKADVGFSERTSLVHGQHVAVIM